MNKNTLALGGLQTFLLVMFILIWGTDLSRGNAVCSLPYDVLMSFYTPFVGFFPTQSCEKLDPVEE